MVRLLTVSETAKALRIGLSTAYQLCQRNELPVVRVGGQIRVDGEALEQWIKKQSTVSRARRSKLQGA